MRHYSLERWVDHLRGLGSDSARQAMRTHLDEGCLHCARRLNALRRVLKTAVDDARLATPAFAIRAVKALFALAPPERRLAAFDSLSLTPTFDSALAPGVRSGAAAVRHLALAGDDYLLDVAFERPTDGRAGLVEGQLRHRSGAPMAHTPVHLYTATRLAVSGFTDERGDFELAMPEEAPTELLFLAMDEGRCLVVDVDPGSRPDERQQ